jgi:hypothetical protein
MDGALRQLQTFMPVVISEDDRKDRRKLKHKTSNRCLPPRCDTPNCGEFAVAMYADADNHGYCLCERHSPQAQ